jgi:hypothetical protein
MAKTLMGAQTPIWGTIGDAEIIVDNISETNDSEWEELTDGEGDYIAVVAHGEKGEISMDFTLRDGNAASYLNSPGTEITLPTDEDDINKGSHTLYLVSTEKTKSKGSFMTGTLTANYYPEMS